MSIPQHVIRFRKEYRVKEIGPRYRGPLHFAFTSVGSIGIIAAAILQLENVHLLEWLTIPLGFLIANYAEYRGHMGPMHHPVRGLKLLFQRHTQEHHHFFTHDAMAYESTRDYKMVLFPPIMLFFFLGAIATPIALALFLLTTANVGWLFVATAMSYFLCYEWLHFAYHLPAITRIGRIGFVAHLRKHHAVHHNLALMGKWNFNITFPICDRIFGTHYGLSLKDD